MTTKDELREEISALEGELKDAYASRESLRESYRQVYGDRADLLAQRSELEKKIAELEAEPDHSALAAWLKLPEGATITKANPVKYALHITEKTAAFTRKYIHTLEIS